MPVRPRCLPPSSLRPRQKGLFQCPRAILREGILLQPCLSDRDQAGIPISVLEGLIKVTFEARILPQHPLDAPTLLFDGRFPTAAAPLRLILPLEQMGKQYPQSIF